MSSPRPLVFFARFARFARLARFAALALCAAASVLGACGDDPGASPPFVDPPALPTMGVTWINADPAPTIEGLKGQVVFIEFGWLH